MNNNIYEKLKNLDIRLNNCTDRKDKFVTLYDIDNDAFYVTTAMCILSDNIDMCFHKIDKKAYFIKGNKLMGHEDIDLFGVEDYERKYPNCCIDIIKKEIEEKTRFRPNTLLYKYLVLYKNNPHVEQLLKTGFKKLICELLDSPINDYENTFAELFCEGTTVSSITGLDNCAWKTYLKYFENSNTAIHEYRLYLTLVKKYNVLPGEISKMIEMIKNGKEVKVSYIEFCDVITLLEESTYSFKGLLNYLKKQQRQNSITPRNTLSLLKDYHNMCRELDIEPYIKPDNIKKTHDDIVDIYNQFVKKKKEKETEKYKKAFETQKHRLEKYLYEDNNLKVVLPTCPADLILEGQNQHNCVASYIPSHANQSTNIFFIRKKENPDESYITVEINEKTHKVVQARYKHNKDLNRQDKEFVDKWLRCCFA